MTVVFHWSCFTIVDMWKLNTLNAVSLSMWYSSLDRVWLGATTMESPETSNSSHQIMLTQWAEANKSKSNLFIKYRCDPFAWKLSQREHQVKSTYELNRLIWSQKNIYQLSFLNPCSQFGVKRLFKMLSVGTKEAAMLVLSVTSDNRQHPTQLQRQWRKSDASAGLA